MRLKLLLNYANVITKSILLPLLDDHSEIHNKAQLAGQIFRTLSIFDVKLGHTTRLNFS